MPLLTVNPLIAHILFRDTGVICCDGQAALKGQRMTAQTDAWNEYRKRRNIALFALFGYVPVVFTVALVSIRLFSTLTPAFVLAFAWMVFFAVAGNVVIRFACPRCGKPFFTKWWYHNTFARRCVHCGLPKYADPTEHAG